MATDGISLICRFFVFSKKKICDKTEKRQSYIHFSVKLSFLVPWGC